MEPFNRPAAGDISQLVTQKPPQRTVCITNSAISLQHNQEIRCMLHERVKPLLALSQLLFDLSTFGDVSRDETGSGWPSLLVLDRTYGQMNRETTAVLGHASCFEFFGLRSSFESGERGEQLTLIRIGG